MYTVGAVPYVNAIPLVAQFEELGKASPVRVVYDVPSRLPALLKSAEAQAVLVSSIDALRVGGRRMAAGVCIGSDGPVKSVRLFSRVPPSQIRTLALDESSMTSNHLAQIILMERFQIRPSTRYKAPDLAAMLQDSNACVLIGDIGMAASSLGLHVLDLGDEWRRITGLPFVWAAWIGGGDLTAELAGHLRDAAAHYRAGKRAATKGMFGRFEHGATDDNARQEALLAIARRRANWPDATLRDYLMRVMVYEMDQRMLDGFREFQRLLLAHGFADCDKFPELVAPSAGRAPRP